MIDIQGRIAAVALTSDPEFMQSLEEADEDFAAGRAKPIDEFIDELEKEEQ